MPTLKEVRAGFKAIIEANISGLGVYHRVVGNINVPCVVVVPAMSDFLLAFGRGYDEWPFDLHVLMQSADDEVGQDQLDDHITGAGPRSLVQVLAANNSLGLEGVSTCPVGITAYNFRFTAVSADHIGATLRVRTLVSNR